MKTRKRDLTCWVNGIRKWVLRIETKEDRKPSKGDSVEIEEVEIHL